MDSKSSRPTTGSSRIRAENLETRLAQIEREMAENPQDYQLLQQLCEEKDQLEEQLLELYEQLDSPVCAAVTFFSMSCMPRTASSGPKIFA